MRMADLTGAPHNHGAPLGAQAHLNDSQSMLYHLRCKDGHRIPTETRLSWHMWRGERVIFALGRDLIERLQADAKLREQAQLIELVPAAVFDLDGRVMFWSKAAEQMSGRTIEEVLDKPLQHAVQTKFPLPTRSVVAALRNTGRWEGELPITSADGSPQIIYCHAVLYQDELSHQPKVLEVHFDLTAQKRAEAAAIAAEARLINALLLGGAGTWQWDATEDWMSWEPVLAEILDTATPESLEEALNLHHSADQNSGATKVTGRLYQEYTTLHLEVDDNGCGMAISEDDSQGLGLRGMQERARQFGGALVISTSRHGGVLIAFRIPLSPQAS